MKKDVKMVNDQDSVKDILIDTAHATRLLRRKRNGGWRLPENSPFIFDPENGVTRKVSGTASSPTKKS